MAGLKDQFMSVDPKSLIGQGSEDDVLESDADENSSETEVSSDGENDESSENSEENESNSRTIDNVYGELTRKQNDFQEKILGEIGRLVSQVSDLASVKPAGPQGPKTLEDYSSAELTAYRDKLPAEDPQRENLSSAIANAIVNEKVQVAVNDITGRDRLQSQREAAVTEAIERYEDLADETSSFYQKVDAKVKSLDPNYVAANPRVVMDVANEVAIAAGINPTKARQVLRVPGKLSASKREGAAPAPENDDELLMSEKEARKIATSLKGALGRELTDKELLDIRKNHKSYYDNRSMFTR